MAEEKSNMTAEPGKPATYPHVLACDQDEPGRRQRRWFLKALSGRGLSEFQAVRESGLVGRPFLDLMFAQLAAVIDRYEVGGLPHRPTAGELDQMLTTAEAWELWGAAAARQRPTATDLGN